MLKNLGKHSNYGTLILRVIVGLVFIVHGYLKLAGLEGTGGFLSSLGVPAAGLFAIIVALVEFLGGIALVVGLFTRYLGSAGCIKAQSPLRKRESHCLAGTRPTRTSPL